MADTISAADIKDRLIKKIVTADTTYFTAADVALVDIASSKGIDEADISYTPNDEVPHYRVIEFEKAWVGYQVCKDNMGVTPQKITEEQIVEDPYSEKLKFYTKELAEKTAQLTNEVIENTADEPEEYASSSVNLFRR